MAEPLTVLFAIDLPSELRAWFDAQLAVLPHAPALRALYANPDPGTDWAESDAARFAAQADVIVGWRCTAEFLAAATRLKLWIFPGVGVQRLVPLFTALPPARRPVLCNCHGNTYATAQHAVALLLALANRIVPHHIWLAAGRWRTGDADGASTTLRRRRAGLLGYGKVNQKVHRFLAGFELEFHALRRHPGATAPALPLAAEYGAARIGEFMAACDFVVCALPETPQTLGLVGARELDALGPQGLLVNVGRGPVIDEAALFHALRDGRLGGAALDVWYDYRPEPDAQGRKYPYSAAHPFHELENVVLSPHRAASPIYAPERWDEVLQLIERHAGGRELFNVIDLAAGY